MNDVVSIKQCLPAAATNREQVDLLEEMLMENSVEEIEEISETTHQIVGGMYIRMMRVKKGAVITGAVYKVPNVSFLLSGSLSHINDDFYAVLEAPMTVIGRPFTKRAGLALSDFCWVTVCHTPYETLEETYEYVYEQPPTH